MYDFRISHCEITFYQIFKNRPLRLVVLSFTYRTRYSTEHSSPCDRRCRDSESDHSLRTMTVTATTSVCPSCGASASGRFCSTCGSSLGGGSVDCAGCHQPLPAGARFCRHCGTSVGGAAPVAEKRDRLPWIITGASAVALLAVVVAFLAKK